MEMKKYLGDGVHVEFDFKQWAYVLTTGYGSGPSNAVVMPPEVLQALIDYANELQKQLKAELEIGE